MAPSRLVCLSVLWTSLAVAAATAEKQVTVDFRQGTLGPLKVRDSIDEVRKKLGKENVRAFTFEAEGMPETGHNVIFPGGATAKRFSHFYEFESPAFRTPEGLGVGSTWKEFQETYPEGKMSWASDAYAVWSEKYKFRLFFPSRDRAPAPADKLQSFHW